MSRVLRIIENRYAIWFQRSLYPSLPIRIADSMPIALGRILSPSARGICVSRISYFPFLPLFPPVQPSYVYIVELPSATRLGTTISRRTLDSAGRISEHAVRAGIGSLTGREVGGWYRGTGGWRLGWWRTSAQSRRSARGNTFLPVVHTTSGTVITVSPCNRP